MRVNDHIRYEPDEGCPPVVALGVALQGGVLALSNTVAIVTIFAVASDSSENYLSWAVFASLVISGAVMAMQSARLGRLGSGQILLTGPSVAFMAVCVLAVEEGGCR